MVIGLNEQEGKREREREPGSEQPSLPTRKRAKWLVEVFHRESEWCPPGHFEGCWGGDQGSLLSICSRHMLGLQMLPRASSACMEDLKDDLMGRSATSGGGLDSQREELIQFWVILLLSVEGRMFLSTVLWKLNFSKNNYINPFIEKGGIPDFVWSWLGGGSRTPRVRLKC